MERPRTCPGSSGRQRVGAFRGGHDAPPKKAKPVKKRPFPQISRAAPVDTSHEERSHRAQRGRDQGRFPPWVLEQQGFRDLLDESSRDLYRRRNAAGTWLKREVGAADSFGFSSDLAWVQSVSQRLAEEDDRRRLEWEMTERRGSSAPTATVGHQRRIELATATFSLLAKNEPEEEGGGGPAHGGSGRGAPPENQSESQAYRSLPAGKISSGWSSALSMFAVKSKKPSATADPLENFDDSAVDYLTAEVLLQRVFVIRARAFGVGSPNTRPALEKLLQLYDVQVGAKDEEAAELRVDPAAHLRRIEGRLEKLAQSLSCLWTGGGGGKSAPPQVDSLVRVYNKERQHFDHSLPPKNVENGRGSLPNDLRGKCQDSGVKNELVPAGPGPAIKVKTGQELEAAIQRSGEARSPLDSWFLFKGSLKEKAQDKGVPTESFEEYCEGSRASRRVVHHVLAAGVCEEGEWRFSKRLEEEVLREDGEKLIRLDAQMAQQQQQQQQQSEGEGQGPLEKVLLQVSRQDFGLASHTCLATLRRNISNPTALNVFKATLGELAAAPKMDDFNATVSLTLGGMQGKGTLGTYGVLGETCYITYSYAHRSGQARAHSPTDWVGLFRVDDKATTESFVAWRLVPPESQSSMAVSGGVISTPGIYRAKYFVGGSESVLATSGNLRVEKVSCRVGVALSSSSSSSTATLVAGDSLRVYYEFTYAHTLHSPGDWVGIIAEGAEVCAASALLRQLLPAENKGEVLFEKGPILPGQYRVHVFLSQFDDALAGSSYVFETALHFPFKEIETAHQQREVLVYVSTRWDMTMERDVLSSVAMPALKALFDNRHVRFRFVDLRSEIAAMDLLTPTNVRAILDSVNSCRPHMIFCMGDTNDIELSPDSLDDEIRRDFPWLADALGMGDASEDGTEAAFISTTDVELLSGFILPVMQEELKKRLSTPCSKGSKEGPCSCSACVPSVPRRLRAGGLLTVAGSPHPVLDILDALRDRRGDDDDDKACERGQLTKHVCFYTRRASLRSRLHPNQHKAAGEHEASIEYINASKTHMARLRKEVQTSTRKVSPNYIDSTAFLHQVLTDMESLAEDLYPSDTLPDPLDVMAMQRHESSAKLLAQGCVQGSPGSETISWGEKGRDTSVKEYCRKETIMDALCAYVEAACASGFVLTVQPGSGITTALLQFLQWYVEGPGPRNGFAKSHPVRVDGSFDAVPVYGRTPLARSVVWRKRRVGGLKEVARRTLVLYVNLREPHEEWTQNKLCHFIIQEIIQTFGLPLDPPLRSGSKDHSADGSEEHLATGGNAVDELAYSAEEGGGEGKTTTATTGRPESLDVGDKDADFLAPWFERLGALGDLVLLLDGVDVLESAELAQGLPELVFSWLPTPLPSFVRVVATCQAGGVVCRALERGDYQWDLVHWRLILSATMKESVCHDMLKRWGVGCVVSYMDAEVLLTEVTGCVAYLRQLLEELHERGLFSALQLPPGLHPSPPKTAAPAAAESVETVDELRATATEVIQKCTTVEHLVALRLDRVLGLEACAEKCAEGTTQGQAAAGGRCMCAVCQRPLVRAAVFLIALSAKGLASFELHGLLQLMCSRHRQSGGGKRSNKGTNLSSEFVTKVEEKLAPFATKSLGLYRLQGHVQAAAIRVCIDADFQAGASVDPNVPAVPMVAAYPGATPQPSRGLHHTSRGFFLQLLVDYFSLEKPSLRNAVELPHAAAGLVRAAARHSDYVKKASRYREKLLAIITDCQLFELAADQRNGLFDDLLEYQVLTKAPPSKLLHLLRTSFESTFQIDSQHRQGTSYQLLHKKEVVRYEDLHGPGARILLRIAEFTLHRLRLTEEAQSMGECAACLMFGVSQLTYVAFQGVECLRYPVESVLECLRFLTDLYFSLAVDMYALFFKDPLDPASLFHDLPFSHVVTPDTPPSFDEEVPRPGRESDRVAAPPPPRAAAAAKTANLVSPMRNPFRSVTQVIKFKQALRAASEEGKKARKAYDQRKLEMNGVVTGLGSDFEGSGTMSAKLLRKPVNPGGQTREERGEMMRAKTIVSRMLASWPRVCEAMGVCCSQTVKIRLLVKDVAGASGADCWKNKRRQERNRRRLQEILMKSARFERVAQVVRERQAQSTSFVVERDDILGNTLRRAMRGAAGS